MRSARTASPSSASTSGSIRSSTTPTRPGGDSFCARRDRRVPAVHQHDFRSAACRARSRARHPEASPRSAGCGYLPRSVPRPAAGVRQARRTGSSTRYSAAPSRCATSSSGMTTCFISSFGCTINCPCCQGSARRFKRVTSSCSASALPTGCCVSSSRSSSSSGSPNSPARAPCFRTARTERARQRRRLFQPPHETNPRSANRPARVHRRTLRSLASEAPVPCMDLHSTRAERTARKHRAQGCIFVSYASPDLEVARYVVSQLQDAGCLVWFDKEQLQTGENWEEVLREAVEERCGLFLSIISDQTAATARGPLHLRAQLARPDDGNDSWTRRSSISRCASMTGTADPAERAARYE